MKYDVPEHLQPLSPWYYFLINFVYSIPLFGQIILIVHAVAAANVNRKNYARSFFCFLALILIVSVVFAATGLLASFWEALKNVVQS